MIFPMSPSTATALAHRTRRALPILAALATLTLPAALAQSTAATAADSTDSLSVHLDPSRTAVAFTAGSLLARVRGTFLLKGGIFAINTLTGVADGEILVDAATEKSNDSSLDKKIRDQTLQTVTYPTILFHPEKVSGTLPSKDGQTHLTLSGTFTIHGQDHPLTVDVLTTRSGSQVDFTTQFTVPYVKWGMKDAGTFFMRDRNVRITVTSHGVLEGIQTGS